jgi:predicted O-methyltransferase YrrM
MAKYNITRIVPEGFLHTSAFLEVIDSLAWALSSLGHDVNVTQNWLSEHGETNIVFGAEVMAPFQRLPHNSIIYNLEQPSHPNMDKVRAFARGVKVWDFSASNVKDWQDRAVEAYHVPVGYTPNLTRIPKSSEQDIDVCFWGWLTPRRVALLDSLQKAGLKVYSGAACYGGGRDNIISRSKVCLNVHHDGRDMFEIVRCSYLFANSKCVISEQSVDDSDYPISRISVDYRALLDHCVTYARDHGAVRRSMEHLALEDFRKLDFRIPVRKALEGVKEVMPAATTTTTTDLTGGQPSVKRAGDVLTRAQERYERGCAEGDMRDFLPWLRAHAKGNVMEIGVRDGASTSAFLLGLEEHGGHLYSVDVMDCSALFAGHPQWTFIHANSTDLKAVGRHMPYELDLLLIDGDHSRAGVLADFQYARQLRPGGCVLFHDIDPACKPPGCSAVDWPGDAVRDVFEELSAALAPQGWKSERLEGKYGMGILWKPERVAHP